MKTTAVIPPLAYSWQQRAQQSPSDEGELQEIMRGRQVLIAYRYASWALTSLFYLLSAKAHTLPFQLGVTLALLVAGWWTVRLYQSAAQGGVSALAVILVETVGIACLLPFTGGLDSPFIWYALNPILVAAGQMRGVYCWLAFATFAIFGTTFSLLIDPIALERWEHNKLQLLVFLLITLAAQAFSYLLGRLSSALRELSCSHDVLRTLLQRATSLYQSLEIANAERDVQRFGQMLAQHTRQVAEANAAFCMLAGNSGGEMVLVSDQGQIDNALKYEIGKVWSLYQKGKPELTYIKAAPTDLSAGHIAIMPIATEHQMHGLLGCMLDGDCRRKDTERSLEFLGKLGALVIENSNQECLRERLAIAEEQNRIANEIHDGVSQHLFSISYALHGLSQRADISWPNGMRDELELLKRTAIQAARELRASIYRLNTAGLSAAFTDEIATFLDDLGHLNGLRVGFSTEGSEEVLSPALRQALYRVVREATANAARHALATTIDVKLTMLPNLARLEIVDDGKGFEPDKMVLGLGLRNMRSLMASFGGSLRLESKAGAGTSIICQVPAEISYVGRVVK